MAALQPAAILLLAIGVGAQQSGMSVADFRAADQTAKARVLTDLTTARVDTAVGQVIVLVRAGLEDVSADVRMAALGAVRGRAMAARWAGTPGPGVGPGTSPRPAPPDIPAEWQGDQRALLDALGDDCLALLKGDSDERVRHQALLALWSLEGPTQADGPLSVRMVGLFVDLYRHDPFARIRAEVVKAFRLVPNDTPEMRAVLRDALVDPNASVRHEGLAGITPAATAAPRRLSFAEARDTIAAALKHGDPGVRLGAVQALNVFGAPAAPYIPTLERLMDVDPDARVRDSARLAIESIRRALRAAAEDRRVSATVRRG